MSETASKAANVLSAPLPDIDPKILAERRSQVKDDVLGWIDDEEDMSLGDLKTVIIDAIDEIVGVEMPDTSRVRDYQNYFHRNYDGAEYICVETACFEGGYNRLIDGDLAGYFAIETRIAIRRAYDHASHGLEFEIADEKNIGTAHERIALRIEDEAANAASAQARQAEMERRQQIDAQAAEYLASRGTPSIKYTFCFDSFPCDGETSEHTEDGILYRATLKYCDGEAWDSWEEEEPRHQAEHLKFIEKWINEDIYALGVIVEAFHLDEDGDAEDEAICEHSLWSIWPNANGDFADSLEETAEQLLDEVRSKLQAETRAAA